MRPCGIKRKLKNIALCSLPLFVLACGPAVPPPAATVERSVEAPAEQENSTENSTEALETATSADPFTAPKIKVAIMLPLSGSEATTGNALLRAAVTAMFDAYDPRLLLIPMDTKADILETEKMAHRAIEENVAIVLGPLLASNLAAAGNILAPAGIPLIGFSNDSNVAAPGRYIMGFMPETEVKRIVDHAFVAGLVEQAALLPDGRYGDRVRAAFGDALTAAGGKVAAIENYPPDPEAVFEPVKRLSNYDERRKDLRDEVRFLRSLRDDLTDEIADEISKSEVLEGISYDAVLLPEGGELLGTLAPLLPFYEIDPNNVKLLGTGLWSDPALLREPPLQGAWFAAPHPGAANDFLLRLEREYGDTPPRIATLAYDAISLVASIAREEIPEGQTMFGPQSLVNEVGFVGLDGLFRFLPDGTIERGLAVLEINRRGFRVIDPAPTAFPSFGYALRQQASQE
jgi:branched-chain amino acid transport system substrate-binding protein